MNSNPVIAVDFDNTIASYDDVLHGLALERQLIDCSVGKNKTAVRTSVRGLPDGEIQWQQLQAAAYGPEIARAKLIDGVQKFFSDCAKKEFRVYIVSHKTEYAAQDEHRTNLRSAAMGWLVDHHFFGPEGLGLNQGDVFFEDTRLDKLNRVKSLGCTHFIDDLEETFLETGVNLELEKILYAPVDTEHELPGVKKAKNWEEIAEYVFHATD
ncbi:MAG: hypothetical protein H8E48_02770 [Chloroflexi bacterium]|nr:hypothetical protein [Chloroflexota bacterium]